jgi:hypothetical protein
MHESLVVSNSNSIHVHQILCSWILCTMYIVHDIFCASMNIVLWILCIVAFVNLILCR